MNTILLLTGGQYHWSHASSPLTGGSGGRGGRSRRSSGGSSSFPSRPASPLYIYERSGTASFLHVCVVTVDRESQIVSR